MGENKIKRRPDPDDDDDVPVRKKVVRGDDEAPRKKKVDADDDDAPRKKKKGDSDDDEAPRKKKKKKKKPEPTRWPLYAGLGAGGVVTILLAIFLIKTMGGDPPAKAVTAWDKYTTEENDFGFKFPSGWKEKSYGKKGTLEADIKGPGGASINMKENLVGSLVADIAGAGSRGDVPDEFLPVSKVHAMRMPTEISGYKEQDAVTVMTRVGKGRRSEYVRGGGFRGYRATVLLQQTALDVYCECRAADWETLRPAFETAIETITRGVVAD